MTIQISPKLLDEISEHIDHLANTAISAQFGSPNDSIPLHICGKDAALMDQIMWGEHIHLRDKVPREWCDQIESDSSTRYADHLRVCLSTDADGEFPGVNEDNFQFILETNNKNYTSPPNCRLYNFRWVLNSKTATGLAAPVYEELKARIAVTTRWQETKTKVQEFLKTCRSLNQAVKLWPEIVNFLPTERRKRLEEENKPKAKKERTTPAPEEVLGQINRDAIAGDLVALRFATA